MEEPLSEVGCLSQVQSCRKSETMGCSCVGQLSDMLSSTKKHKCYNGKNDYFNINCACSHVIVCVQIVIMCAETVTRQGKHTAYISKGFKDENVF